MGACGSKKENARSSLEYVPEDTKALQSKIKQLEKEIARQDKNKARISETWITDPTDCSGGHTAHIDEHHIMWQQRNADPFHTKEDILLHQGSRLLEMAQMMEDKHISLLERRCLALALTQLGVPPPPPRRRARALHNKDLALNSINA